jgi:hypothetical protein
MDSPSIHSPNMPHKKLATSNGQHNTQQLGASSSQQIHQQRQMIKSQCIVPTVSLGQQQVITNLKKSTTRLSSGPGNQLKNTKQKQATSPMPHTIVQNVNLQQQQQTNAGQGSRNMQSSSASQKSLKGVNSHAKYLSGGNEQYQKLLAMQ